VGLFTHQIKEGEYTGDKGKKILEEELEVIDNLIKTITAREEVEKFLRMPFDELGRE
jgi:hypothetical protein